MAETDRTSERWRDAVGYEDRYMVSNHGRVWSKDRIVKSHGSTTRRHKGRYLKQGRKPAGYPIIGVPIEPGVVKQVYVHRMVLEAFAGPCPEGWVARHLDDDKENNMLWNLSWGSESQNGHDKIRNGRDHYSTRDACKWGHEFTPDNIYRRAKYPGTRYCRRCRSDSAERRNRRPEVAEYKRQWQARKAAASRLVT